MVDSETGIEVRKFFGLIIVFIIFLAVIILSSNNKSRVISAANDNLQSGNYQKAIDIARQYDGTDFENMQEADRIIERAYAGLAEDLIDKGQYEDAINLLKEAGPSESLRQESSVELQGTAKRAYDALAKAFLDDKKYEEAIRLMEEAKEMFPGDADEINKDILRVYLKKAGDLRGDNSLYEAYDVLTTIPASYVSYDSDQQVTAGIQSLLDALANGSGEDSGKLITDIKNDFCGGYSIDSNLLPLMGKKGIKGKAIICDSYLPIRSDLLAGNLSELKYAVKKQVSSKNLTPCKYDDGYTLTPQQVTWEITILDIKTQKTVNSHIFIGKKAVCPKTYRFKNGTYYEKLEGDDPSSPTVINYLAGIIR